MEKIKVNSAFVNKAVTVPGTKISAVMSLHPSKHSDVDMVFMPNIGLFMKIPARNGDTKYGLVPLDNINFVLFDHDPFEPNKPQVIKEVRA